MLQREPSENDSSEQEGNLVDAEAGELEEAFKSLNNKKAPGPDGLQADVIKEVFVTNPQYFHSLFNSCLQVGHFPKKWKKAQVVMFHKPKKINGSLLSPTDLSPGLPRESSRQIGYPETLLSSPQQQSSPRAPVRFHTRQKCPGGNLTSQILDHNSQTPGKA
ncbi:hypothetical protein AVEN_235299-1 [Araneus ventricosus]|uniref:Reverse transcriptase domain-containing protein n=1 Tax=Araneus ventricosus TaxID=182803 RepID=A0A4Y2A3E9_ARAVE|nr:hypothetical protein AVEN_235299-1 [Araneus ventricosus]